VFLNIDAGELEDEPEAIFALAQVVNIACGGHAGDEASMAKALERCARLGAAPGAHPSFEDREHFGRRRLEVAPAVLRAQVAGQCARLRALAAPQHVAWVKPHGALYHAANESAALAEAVVGGAVEALGPEVTVLGPPRGALRDAAMRAGVRFAREGFADRGMRADGSLVPRGEPGALLEDPARARAQATRLALGGGVDTLCVHGDTPGAVAITEQARKVVDAGLVALGDGAVRLALPRGAEPSAVLEALREAPGVTDAVVTEQHAAFYFHPQRPLEDPLAALERAREMSPPTPMLHRVRVRYDGPDLDEVARRAGWSREEIVQLHSGGEYRVQVIGFLPGFAYLGDLPEPLRLPRLGSPRPRVPRGAVAVAGRHTAIYPVDSPGGWNLIGTALDFAPFHMDRGIIWALGDRVRFVPEAP
jgi:5-oxoprolinase (ATP-hydrolysing) subunit A